MMGVFLLKLCTVPIVQQSKIAMLLKKIICNKKLFKIVCPPPYSLKKNLPIKQDEERLNEQKSATVLLKAPKESVLEKKFVSASSSSVFPKIEEKTEKEYQEDKNSFWPILLLSIAANLFIVGILQLLFSDEGYLRLEWNSHYWFFYCLASLPLFFLGYKKVHHFK